MLGLSGWRRLEGFAGPGALPTSRPTQRARVAARGGGRRGVAIGTQAWREVENLSRHGMRLNVRSPSQPVGCTCQVSTSGSLRLESAKAQLRRWPARGAKPKDPGDRRKRPGPGAAAIGRGVSLSRERPGLGESVLNSDFIGSRCRARCRGWSRKKEKWRPTKVEQRRFSSTNIFRSRYYKICINSAVSAGKFACPSQNIAISRLLSSRLFAILLHACWLHCPQLQAHFMDCRSTPGY